MPKLEIYDDILAPSDTLTVRFQGKHPFSVAPVVPQLLRYVLKITAKDVWETDIRWDALSDTRDFYGKWAGKRAEDRWTSTIVEVIMHGNQDAKEKTGWVRIQIRGVVKTRYTYTNPIQKMFWYFYNRSFYYKQRRAYIDQGKDFIFQLRDNFQRILGIDGKEKPVAEKGPAF